MFECDWIGLGRYTLSLGSVRGLCDEEAACCIQCSFTDNCRSHPNTGEYSLCTGPDAAEPSRDASRRYAWTGRHAGVRASAHKQNQEKAPLEGSRANRDLVPRAWWLLVQPPDWIRSAVRRYEDGLKGNNIGFRVTRLL